MKAQSLLRDISPAQKEKDMFFKSKSFFIGGVVGVGHVFFN